MDCRRMRDSEVDERQVAAALHCGHSLVAGNSQLNSCQHSGFPTSLSYTPDFNGQTSWSKTFMTGGKGSA